MICTFKLSFKPDLGCANTVLDIILALNLRRYQQQQYTVKHTGNEKKENKQLNMCTAIMQEIQTNQQTVQI